MVTVLCSLFCLRLVKGWAHVGSERLREGLGLHDDQEYFCIFRDHGSGLEYIRNSNELCRKGLYVELGAYKYHVFIDFREVRDNPWHHYAQIAILWMVVASPAWRGFQRNAAATASECFSRIGQCRPVTPLTEARITQPQGQLDQKLMEEIEKKMVNLLREAKRLTGGREDEETLARELRRKLEAILYLPIITSRYPQLQPKGVKGSSRIPA